MGRVFSLRDLLKFTGTWVKYSGHSCEMTNPMVEGRECMEDLYVKTTSHEVNTGKRQAKLEQQMPYSS
jgi:hypothetical protein